MIRLTEDHIIKAICDCFHDCDTDEIARITGDIFGSFCVCISGESGEYLFYPDENDYGAFGKIEQRSTG